MKLFKKSDTTISISTSTIVRTILLTITAVLVLQFISATSHQLTLIAISGFLALALNPAVTWISRRLKIKSRVRAAGLAYVIVITILALFIYFVVPPLVKQGAEFIQDIPETVSEFRTQDTALARFVRNNDLDTRLQEGADEFADNFAFDGAIVSTATRLGGTIVSIITVLVLTFMMLVEGPALINSALSYASKETRAERKRTLQKMYRVVTAYVNGQVLIAAIAASFAMIALLIASAITDAQVNVVAFAGIVFMFGLIPLIGNILAATIVVFFCLFVSTSLAIIMAVFFIVYQQIENATLQPYIQSRGNQLTPLLVFVAALVGGGLGGLLGALVAIPVAGCLRILVEENFEKPAA